VARLAEAGYAGVGDGTPTGFAMAISVAMATEIAPTVLRRRQAGVAAVTLERGIEPGAAERAPWLLLGAKALSYAVVDESDRTGPAPATPSGWPRRHRRRCRDSQLQRWSWSWSWKPTTTLELGASGSAGV
jgi:hypothetical protein